MERLEHRAAVFGGDGEFDHCAHAAGDVVEVMGDSRGQGSDGGHVAGTGEIFFEFLAIGDVAHPGGDAFEGAGGVNDGAQGDTDVNGIFSALGNEGHFIEINRALLDGALKGAAGVGAVFSGDECFKRAAENLGFAPTEHPDGGVIPGEDAAADIERDDGDSGIEDRGLVKIRTDG